jgi:hypothetical protein
MVVNDLDIMRITFPERKTDAPAGVHGHRPLPRSISFELVKSYTPERAHVLAIL